MLFNKISTLMLLALTASAAPTKRQSGGEGVPEPWEVGVTIIPGEGSRGDSPLATGGYTAGDCGNETYVCHELCHVMSNTRPPEDRIQCEDECYREISIQCFHDEEEKQHQEFVSPGAGNPDPGATGAR